MVSPSFAAFLEVDPLSYHVFLGHAGPAVAVCLGHAELPSFIAFHRAYLLFSFAGAWAALEASQVDCTQTLRRLKRPHPPRRKSISTTAAWEVT